MAVLDTGSGRQSGYREGERFPLCSTFKLLAVSLVLQRVDRGAEKLDRRIPVPAAAIVVNSPVTKAHAGSEMTLSELCEAAMTYSDNTAGNLLLESFGGPAALTKFARAIGDSVTRLDRTEPDLNEAVPGDERDTTSPAAMLANLKKLALGSELSDSGRAQLTAWLVANKTGDARIRAGVPHTWRIGDKTASGERGTTNDIAIAWPAEQAPILICSYLTDTSAAAADRNAILAAVGRAVAAAR